ncbi:MAG: septation regulator SpoVG [Defluviitaleaceae bacterium]|nr:septation regulator SpoVG [Defluviitaleaceae bacterium]MCL2189779.1 septation regulator SpoVG [Defluviitaleaceae bacterium]MCL2275411.1 septation regulator SpoVG [Defluviitaleaceae bacterium]
MEITDVRIRRLSTNTLVNKMRAIVSITLEEAFVIHDIKVIQGTDKLFIAMPSRKMDDGTYQDIAHPIKAEFREKIQSAILARYESALAVHAAEA